MGSAAPELAVSSPARVGTVRILERIAVGGMAEVFLGSRDGAAVVVKVLLPHYAKQPDVVALFEHEAALGARLVHPRVVPVLERGTSALGPYLVSPFIAGPTLGELGADPLPYAALLCVAADLTEALVFLHEAADESGASLDIVHRDISPDNAVVDRSGNVSLIDLGIAKSALRSGRTKTGVIRGKVAYAAPELLTGSTVDARADLYGAAVVLFELATGAAYLDGDTEVALLRKAEEPALRLPSSLGADARLDGPLGRALARFPEERFATAREMHAAFMSQLTKELAADGRAELIRRVGPRAELPAVLTLAAMTQADAPTTRTAESPTSRSNRLLPIAGGIVVLGAAALWLLANASDSVTNQTAGESTVESPSAPAETASATVSQAPPPPLPSAPEDPPTSTAVVVADSAQSSVMRSSRVTPPTSSAASTAPPAPAIPSTDASVAPTPVDRASVQAKMADVNRRIAAAKAEGKDVSAAEARIPAALDAYMDGRYEQSNRELDSISASLNR